MCLGPLCWGVSWVCFWVASAQAVVYPKAATAIQTVGDKGYDGFVLALVGE